MYLCGKGTHRCPERVHDRRRHTAFCTALKSYIIPYTPLRLSTMYSSWDSSSLPQSYSANNPFAESSASNRFPALDAPDNSYQASSPSYSSQSTPSFQTPYGYQQPQQQFTQWAAQPQLPSPGLYSQRGSIGFSGGIQPQVTASGGYGQQYGQSNMYGQQPQFIGQSQFISPAPPQQYQQNIINEFDPFARSSAPTQASGGRSWISQPQANIANQFQRVGPKGHQHPRSFIQANKSQLESWNSATWSQVIVTFEELKKAWENHRAELQRRLLSTQYLTSEETAYLNSVRSYSLFMHIKSHIFCL